jgi:Protein of unknown function (DUF995)
MKRRILILFFAWSLAIPVAAADRVKLPATAKAMTAAETIATYDGKKYAWDHPNTDNATGTVLFDFKNSYMSGTWKSGSDGGEWEGKITMKGDQYCYRTRGKGQKKYGKMTCNLMFIDGTTVYEVDPKTKKVLSTDVPI